MRTDSAVRVMACGLVVVAAGLVCLTGCQSAKRAGSNDGAACNSQTRDLRVDRNVQSASSYQLDGRTIRIYWAGENTLAVDNHVQLANPQALIRYLSRQPQSRLQHGVLLVSTSGAGFDPLDVLSKWCVQHRVNLYCVALTDMEPAEPAVVDKPSADDWRAELPEKVHWVVQAGPAIQTVARCKPNVDTRVVTAAPAAAR